MGPHGLHFGKPAEPLGKGLPSTRRDSQEPRSHSKQSPAAQTQVQRIEEADKCFISTREGGCGEWADLVQEVPVLQAVQLALHVVDVLVDLLHTLAVPHDLILVNLRARRS